MDQRNRRKQKRERREGGRDKKQPQARGGYLGNKYGRDRNREQAGTKGTATKMKLYGSTGRRTQTP